MMLSSTMLFGCIKYLKSEYYGNEKNSDKPKSLLVDLAFLVSLPAIVYEVSENRIKFLHNPKIFYNNCKASRRKFSSCQTIYSQHGGLVCETVLQMCWVATILTAFYRHYTILIFNYYVYENIIFEYL